MNIIRTTLQNLGLDDFWDGQFNFANVDNRVKQRVSVRRIFFKVAFKFKHINLSRFRCMNHRLPIEFGRILRLERAKRKCKLCKVKR